MPPPVALTPEQSAEQEARRQRAALLRSFEASTISRANFCTLKRISDADLEVQLVQAQAERKLDPAPQRNFDERPQGARPPSGPRHDDRGGDRGNERGNDRGPRREGGRDGPRRTPR